MNTKVIQYAINGKPRIARKHGHTTGAWSPTYQTWAYMIQRCTNANTHSYRWYGARGIGVCDRWLKFVNFLADMGERPAGKTLDRINNDGNYEPGNCRWATRAQQFANKRPSTLVVPPKPMEGKRFGRFLVLSFSHRGNDRRAHWLCRCDCGVEKSVGGTQLRRGLTKSCGCIQRKQRVAA